MSPLKYVWILSLVVETALALGLIISTRRPMLRFYLATAVIDPLHYTALWNTGLEFVAALAIIGMALERTYFLSFSIKYFAERVDRRIMCGGLVILLISMVIKSAPRAYPDYPESWYFIRVYSTFTAGAICAAAAIYHFWSVKWKFIDRSFPAVLVTIWCAVLLWASKQPHTYPFWFQAGILRLSVQSACLVAWMLISPKKMADPVHSLSQLFEVRDRQPRR